MLSDFRQIDYIFFKSVLHNLSQKVRAFYVPASNLKYIKFVYDCQINEKSSIPSTCVVDLELFDTTSCFYGKL